MLTGLATLILVGSAAAKIVGAPGMMGALAHARELTCLALYVNPRSKVLGAVLLTRDGDARHGGEHVLPPVG